MAAKLNNGEFIEPGSDDTMLLKLFSDKALKAELNRREVERHKLEMVKIIAGRDPVGYKILTGGIETASFTEWRLSIMFSDGSQHTFSFSEKAGQSEETAENFKKVYFPNTVRLDWQDWERMKKKNKKKVCQTA